MYSILACLEKNDHYLKPCFQKNKGPQQKSGSWKSFKILLFISLKISEGSICKNKQTLANLSKNMFFEKIGFEVAFTYKTGNRNADLKIWLEILHKIGKEILGYLSFGVRPLNLLNMLISQSQTLNSLYK